jgi:hypothetical protein
VYRKIGYGLLGLAALALTLHARRAAAQSAAQPESVRVSVTVEADAGCATAAALAEQVHARSQRIEFVEDTGDIPRLRVAIGAPVARERVAELSVRWPDGRHSERRLSAESCAAALDALALLVAMTLDPAALAGTQAEPPPTQPATPQPEAAETPSSTDDAASRAAIVSPPPNAPAPSVPTANEPHPLRVRHVAVGASAQLASGPAPEAMPGFGVYGLLSLNGTPLWAPALQLQLARTWTNGLSEAGGDADFALDTAQLELCPAGVQLSSFAARACVAAAIGRLSASGSNSYAPQTHHEPWASLGGGLLVALGLGQAELQAGFELNRPLWRYEFAFRPDVFHRVPGLCWSGQIGAGVRFP